MLLYDMGDPIHAVEILGPDIRSVHVKDARRPTVPGTMGPGGPARAGARWTSPASSGHSERVGYSGPLMVEREVGDQAARVRDIGRRAWRIRDAWPDSGRIGRLARVCP